MFPQTVITPFKLVVEPLATLALNEAFTRGAIIDHDNPEFRIDGSFAIPIAACRADFDFGRKDQFFNHVGLCVSFGLHGSRFFSNGSMKLPFAGYNQTLPSVKQV